MRDVIDERGGVVMGCGPRGGGVGWISGGKEKERKKEKNGLE